MNLSATNYAGRPPEVIPFCTIRDAAGWLQLPKSTVRAWVLGQQNFKPVIQAADSERGLLSFQNLVEVHVLAAVRRKHAISLPRVRTAVDFIRARLGVERPLSDKQMFTLGTDIVVEHLGQILNVKGSGQLLIRETVEGYLKRVDRDSHDGHPIRLYPFSRQNFLDSPRSVVIDPRVQFGRPCLAGTGIPTAIIAERVWAGEDLAEIAADYRREVGDVEEAIRFELGVREAA